MAGLMLPAVRKLCRAAEVARAGARIAAHG
jgi:hypothetical protein